MSAVSASPEDAIAAESLELRVLSGLQAGAALPLEDGLVAGSGDDADLLLFDDGIAATQLRVIPAMDGSLLLEGLAAGVGVAERSDVEPGTPVRIAIGEPFRAGPVWLVVRRVSESWESWTPPSASPRTLIEANEVGPTTEGDLEDEPLTPIASTDASRAAPPEILAITADARPGPAPGSGASTGKRPMRALGSVIVASGLLSTMLGVAALVRQAVEVNAPAAPSANAAPAISTVAPSAPASAGAPRAGDGTDQPLRPVGGASEPLPSHDLAPVGETERSIGGDRLIVRLPGEGTVTLPFDIREVLFGAQSHVVLTDGRRLEPGDQVGEWRLADIRPGALVFDGPRKVTVGW